LGNSLSWSTIHASVHQCFKRDLVLPILPARRRLLIAVSGGQDSLCLGKILLDLATRWNWDLAIAHCDHGWSMDGGIADHVAQVAATWQLPFYLRQAAQPIQETEAAARQWRYQQLTELAIAEHFDHIVTGHTLSDRAETLLYNLSRGAGMAGITALTWQRQLTPELSLIRPLLGVSRTETAAFCAEFQLPIYLDPYNQNLKFARNRLRQQVMPELQTINPQVEKHLAHTSEILHQENEYLEAIATQHLQTSLNDQQHLYRPALQALHPALQRRVSKQYLQQLLPQMPTFKQIETLTQLITAPNKSRTSSLPGNIQLYVDHQWIKYCRDHKVLL
jgi:tRNA(Ile)-lysidine synthase